MITFEPLYSTLKRKELTLGKLAERLGITYVSLHDMMNNPNTRVSYIERICLALDCEINDVVSDNGQYETGWESLLDEIKQRRNRKNYRLEEIYEVHPWLKGIDVESAWKILFPHGVPAIGPSESGRE